MSQLDDVIGEVLDRSSVHWMFYHPDEVGECEIVEARFNARNDFTGDFTPPAGWILHRIQWGDTFFIRRNQSMSEPKIEEMLLELLRFAANHRLDLHSWETGPDLAPDGFHP